MSTNNSMMFLNTPKKILNIFGVWLIPDRSLFYKIYTISILTSQYIFISLKLAYMAIIWGDLVELSDSAYFFFTQMTLCFKTTAFVVNKRNVNELLMFMDSKAFAPQSDKHMEILVKNSKSTKNLYLCLVIGAITTVFGWTLIPLLKNNNKALPCPIWMPECFYRSPFYEVTYIYQSLAMCAGGTVYVSVDVITVGMMIFSCAQIDIIMDKMQQISRVPWSSRLNPEEWKKLTKDNNQLLIECIEHHQAVIRFIEQVDNTFHINILMQVCGTVIIVCMSIFRISVEPFNAVRFFSNFNFLFTILLLLFVYCWFGNELTKRNEDLRDSLYRCPWYEQDLKFRKVLLIAMECMKRPIVFKAGHYVPLSRPTFISILRCSYSYFAVLNQAKYE